VDHAHIPFQVNPNVDTLSPVVSLQCPTSYEFALFLVTQFIPKNLGVLTGGIVNVDFDSELEVVVGGALGVGYDTTIAYAQSNVPAYIKIDYSFAGLTKRSLGSDNLSLSATVDFEKRNEPLASLSPSERRAALASMTDEDLYQSVVSLVGEHAPAKDAEMAYVAWMEKAIRALHPEHQ